MDKRSYADRSEYLKAKVTERRKSLRKQAIKLLGGCCYICKYAKCEAALEFHHLNKDEKDFAISARGLTRSWIKIESELKKCVLVCANCHREIHNGLIDIHAALKGNL